jgi:hypothetical protein
MIKKIACFLLLTTSLSIYAEELTSYSNITEALTEGNDVTVVIKDTQCKMTDPNVPQIPKSTMVHHVQSVVFRDDLLSFDAVKFAFARPPRFNENINQRAVFILTSSEEVMIQIDFFSAETNKKLDTLKPVTINCQLGDGAKFYKR